MPTPDRLTTALQSALQHDPALHDLQPDPALRTLLLSKLATAYEASVTEATATAANIEPVTEPSSPRNQPMTKSSTQFNWRKTLAILGISTSAAAVAIALLLPATQSVRESVKYNKNSQTTKPNGWTSYPDTDNPPLDILDDSILKKELSKSGGALKPTPDGKEILFNIQIPAYEFQQPQGKAVQGEALAVQVNIQPQNGQPSQPAISSPMARSPVTKDPTPSIPPGDPAPRGAEGLQEHRTRTIQTAKAENEVVEKLAIPPIGFRSVDQSKTDESRRKYAERETGAEQYEQLIENAFAPVRQQPLSTFSIDVDTASYTNARRFLTSGQLPPPAAIRIEEFINYFQYNYPQPTGTDPFSVNMETASCPWNDGHLLLRVGLKGKEIDRRERPASNLVFLVDVSGSMSSNDKLPLLRAALHEWTNELTDRDSVSIVTYAGDTGVRLAPTRGTEKEKIHAAIETLQSGGSTNGSAGITLAYEQASERFLRDGVNRILWATDGDLNVGITSDDELVKLITDKAKTGVFLTVLGVGTGNLKDAKLEKMADRGNGIYAYLDTPKEARKVLVEQMSGSTITIAKDVKLQLEFNPAVIASYRLVGYENRLLAAQDFHDDKKDAGEIGAGHTVTAIYELIPTEVAAARANQPAVPAGETLKYQQVPAAAPADLKLTDAAANGELLTLKLRFKQPTANESTLREYPLQTRGGKFTAASGDFQFACCVAQFAMWLRDSEYRGTMTPAAFLEIAAANVGDDKNGSRKEFVELVKLAMQRRGQ